MCPPMDRTADCLPLLIKYTYFVILIFTNWCNCGVDEKIHGVNSGHVE